MWGQIYQCNKYAVKYFLIYRFSLLLLDPGEIYFEDFSAYYYPPGLSEEEAIKRSFLSKVKFIFLDLFKYFHQNCKNQYNNMWSIKSQYQFFNWFQKAKRMVENMLKILGFWPKRCSLSNIEGRPESWIIISSYLLTCEFLSHPWPILCICWLNYFVHFWKWLQLHYYF